MAADELLELPTPHGPARAHVHRAPRPVGALVLGHGAGGTIAAPDLAAVTAAAGNAGWTAVLVEQPYRVAGRRNAAPARQLDAAWVAVLDALRSGALDAGTPSGGAAGEAREGDALQGGADGGGLLITGGRSSGARVACRTAAAVGADAVLCLAFPLLAPRRTGEPVSRQGELDAVRVPVLVVQGRTDRFGMPAPGPPLREVVALRGDHRLAGDLPGLTAAVTAWLAKLPR